MGSRITVTDEIEAYRAEPDGEARGGVVLIHEIWGLVPHIEDVADRFAAAGYLTIAPDLLSHIGMDRRWAWSCSRTTRPPTKQCAPQHSHGCGR